MLPSGVKKVQYLKIHVKSRGEPKYQSYPGSYVSYTVAQTFPDLAQVFRPPFPGCPSVPTVKPGPFTHVNTALLFLPLSSPFQTMMTRNFKS